MRPTTRKVISAGAALAALTSIGLAVPATADAHGRHDRSFSRHHAPRTASAATVTLRQALRTDCAAERTSVKAARDAFNADQSVIDAKAARTTAFAAAVTGADFLAAIQAYDAATAGAKATLDGAVAAAHDARWTADNAAYGAFDTATVVDNGAITAGTIIAARATYRANVHALRDANAAIVKLARATFQAATLPAYAQLLADRTAATTDAQRDAARATFKAAVATDWATYKGAVSAARTTLKTGVAAEAATYTATTGQAVPRYKMRGCNCGGGEHI